MAGFFGAAGRLIFVRRRTLMPDTESSTADGMKLLIGALILLTAAHAARPPDPGNWCQVGQKVMIPDGREGPVTSVEGEICRVLVDGEKYVSLWAYYVIEPAYPRYGR